MTLARFGMARRTVAYAILFSLVRNTLHLVSLLFLSCAKWFVHWLSQEGMTIA